MNNIFNINCIYKDQILKEKNHIFIIIDIETCNGRKLHDNAVINIAFMFVGVDYIFKTYCKPDENITWRYLDENQKQLYNQLILKEDIKNTPNLKDVLIQFNKIIHYENNLIPILLAHNSGTESSILNYCYRYYNIKLDEVLWCNTMNKKILEKDKLEFFVNNFEIEKTLKFHYAENDVYYLNKCLLKKHTSYKFLIPKILEVAYKFNENPRYFKIIKKYEKYLKNNNNTNEKQKIEDTKFYEFIIKGEEKIKSIYKYDIIMLERYYRIIQFMNINDENFIIKSKITPKDILELKDEDYNNFIEIIKNKFVITEKYNSFLKNKYMS